MRALLVAVAVAFVSVASALGIALVCAWVFLGMAR